VKSSVTEFLRDAMSGGDDERATEYLILGVSKRSSLGTTQRNLNKLFDRLDKAVLRSIAITERAPAVAAPPAPRQARRPRRSSAIAYDSSAAGAAVGAALGVAAAALPQMIAGASQAASGIVESAKDKASELFSSAVSGTRAALTTATEWVTDSAAGVAKVAREGAGYVVKELKSGSDRVQSAVSGYVASISDKAVALYDGVKSAPSALLKTQTAIPDGLVMSSRDAVSGLWEETKKTVRSWLWGVLDVLRNLGGASEFKTSGELAGRSASPSEARSQGARPGYGRRELVGGRTRTGEYDSSVNTPAAAGTAGGRGAVSGFAGSATMTPDQSKALNVDAQRFSPQSSALSPNAGAGFNPGLNGVAKQDHAAKESYDFWRGKGLTHVQAMGMVAHEMTESGGNPRALNTKGENSGGLYQWSIARRAAIKQGTGIDVNTASAAEQREAAYWEMQNTEKRAWKMLKNSQSKREAVEAGLQFERPNDRNPAYRMGKFDEYEKRLQRAGTQEPPKPSLAHAVPTPDGAPLTGDLSAPTGLFDKKKRAPLPAILGGTGVSAPDGIGAGKRGDFGSGIVPARATSEGEAEVAPAKRFETRPSDVSEGGKSRDDGGASDGSPFEDSGLDKKRRRALMMNNDAGTYLISHQDAMA
jgi:hypothetical protein